MDSLKKLYNEESLKSISRKIIRAYEMKDLGTLNRLASLINLGTAESSGSMGRLFKRLILIFHPDRMTLIHKLIEKYQQEGQVEKLDRMRTNMDKILTFDLPFKEKIGLKSYRFREDYAFDTMNQPYEDFEADQTINQWEPEEWGFIEAVKNMMYGNLFTEFLPKDLYYLEGILDLSENDLSDLQGVEYCQNITELNLERNDLDNLSGLEQLTNLTSLYLSHNQITNINLLSSLSGLKILDLSFNNIEDIGGLVALEELIYLNLLGNPIKKTPELVLLKQRCPVVLDYL